MAALQAMSLLSSSTLRYMNNRRLYLNIPRFDCSVRASSCRPELPNKIAAKNLILKPENATAEQIRACSSNFNVEDEELHVKLLAIAEAAADRAEMHAIIGAQRNNWNQLLTSSINMITLAASLMAGMSSIQAGGGPSLVAFKLSSMVLFASATGMMLIVDKIQPSQLAEEQRNATRLWNQLERSIYNNITLQAPTELEVDEALDNVLALEKAYPLPLLPGMLEKFPEKVEPTRWWPKLRKKEAHQSTVNELGSNGWSKEVEAEMKGVLRVLKVKDEEQYVRCGKVVLDINKVLAISGPAFAGLAAMVSGFIGCQALSPLPELLAVVAGSLATVANTLEHAGQVGMLFEMFRNCGGFYRRLQEEIELNLGEEDVGKRENGDVFRMKMALRLGRSLSEMKEFAAYASPSCKDEEITEFAGKLF